MIIVHIQGGFGNQLFQYSYGLHLREKYNLDVKFNISFFSNQNQFNKDGNSIRDFELINLLYNEDEVNYELLNTEFIVINKYYSFINKVLKRFNLFLNGWKLFYYFNDEKKEINPCLLKQGSNIILEGYWQDLIFVSDEFSSKIQRSLNKIPISDIFSQQSSINSISIHIRRDDYVNHKTFLVLSHDYYVKAVNLIQSKISNSFFYILSDDSFTKNDLEKIAELFPHSNYKVLQPNSTIIDFCIMSRCNHNIIANSTFSWWASVLNSNKQKIIIAPLKWTNNMIINHDIEKKILPKHIKIK